MSTRKPGYAIVWNSPTGPQISGLCRHPGDSSYEDNGPWRQLTLRETDRFLGNGEDMSEADKKRILARPVVTCQRREVHTFFIGKRQIARRVQGEP